MKSARGLHSMTHRAGVALGAAFLWGFIVACFTARAAVAQDQPGPAAAAATGPTGKRAEKHPANRLAKETSPYLLLHAHNPVDWYPWGEEALARARNEKKLIFLSIGYSSCYWCHVMERESFLDDEVAAYLNKHFVCVKVDREERPDIDQIYMTALAALGRRGGWPLTMILTPDAKPIIGGTYFPPRDKEVELPATNSAPAAAKQKLTGLLTLLNLVTDAWEKDPQQMSDYAGQVAAAVAKSLKQRVVPAARLTAELPAQATAALAEEFDAEFGGFSYSEANPRRPKFPEPSNLLFLLDRAGSGGDKKALRMLSVTLDHMARGGIRDHLGGGFHRYSTDRYWRVPHFEKMLYDNAQLATIYAAAHKLTGNDEYRRVATEMLSFVSRELTAPGGAFYAALDAETDGDEGQFYVWTRDQLTAALEPDELRLLGMAYKTADEPNFEGRYVLEIGQTMEQIAAQQGISTDAARQKLARLREKLLAVRDKRPRPLTDTKILTAWNGLMIRGFADAGRLLGEPQYITTAARAADFVLANLTDPAGRLRRSFAQDQAHLNAYLDDYAFLVDGLIALHRATGERRWLDVADALTGKQIELFWDDQQGGFYFTSVDHEELLARSKDPVDSALPSGNAVAADNLVYLGTALKRPEYLAKAEQTIACFSGLMSESPGAAPRLVAAWAALVEARGKSGASAPAAPSDPQAKP